MNKKLAIVTGSSKGIGKELITILAKNNYDVVITYNTSKEDAYKLQKYIVDNYKVNALVIKCDITKEEDIINLKNTILKRYNHIDILVNNAAYAQDNYIDEKTKEEFMKVLEVNVVGTFLVTKYLYKYMDKGVIVNVSSTDSIDTYSEISMDYCASKAAINNLTKTLALTFSNIKVIGVMPNWTNTESIKEMNQEYLKSELKRIGQEKLEEPNVVAKNIIDLIEDKTVKSGDIRRV
ncbi:MAG: SDR family oxidoreductase [Bacilli bacterium]|nr:SDR family oxidoreductase [Bacilli bacterium]